jgi:phage N-6-adenine-methyltransferase
MSASAKPMHYHGAPVKFDWETPPEVFDPLHAEFGFTLDVCARVDNAKCARFLSPDDDGLAAEWGTEVCWMNPPYGSAIRHWMRKAWEASQQGATVVCLVPSRTDTRWWHDYAVRGEIRFIKGRIKFLSGGQPATHTTRQGATPAPFPCALIVFPAARSPLHRSET